MYLSVSGIWFFRKIATNIQNSAQETKPILFANLKTAYENWCDHHGINQTKTFLEVGR